LDIKDICSIKIFFKGNFGKSKIRPVLILNKTDEKYTIVEITSESPKNPPTYYDQFKEEIKNWEEYGLERKSYIKCKNIHNVKPIKFLRKIGTMSNNDFEFFIQKILGYNS
jgi:mRNA interferase MazF